jgi:predicted DNA-binding transcriptional regulator AlpA
LKALAIPAGANGQPNPPAEDRLLTPEEAAARFGVSVKWLYRHHRRLPFARKLSRRALRFSERGLQHYLATRQR